MRARYAFSAVGSSSGMRPPTMKGVRRTKLLNRILLSVLGGMLDSCAGPGVFRMEVKEGVSVLFIALCRFLVFISIGVPRSKPVMVMSDLF